VLIVLNDVTEQRKTEDRRREFVANVSHELRTPLTNIRSYAETIRDANGDLPRETENSFLDVVIHETDRMTHIVQDLLTLSRLDSGRTEMVMARFPFGEAIDNVLRSIALEAQRHGHELTHEYLTDLPLVMGDRGRIEQVMLNILSNAVKYTPNGGHIHVTAGATEKRVWMEVCDDGIGIPEADRDRIFERFYRVDKARSRDTGGTGLGLSIVRQLVTMHGGTIAVQSKPGQGSTFTVQLPLDDEED
jgi:two-component system sensor histidine kinase VicK